MSGIVQNDNSSAITTVLDCTFVFHLPYKLRSGGSDCLIVIAAGRDVAVNVILGLPFTTGISMVLDFKDNVAMCNAIDHPPFAIDHRCTARTVPASAVRVNVGISVHPVVAELEDYEQWCSAQVSLTHSDQSKTVCFCNVASASTVDASILTVSPSTTSEAQNIPHHNVQSLEGFM